MNVHDQHQFYITNPAYFRLTPGIYLGQCSGIIAEILSGISTDINAPIDKRPESNPAPFTLPSIHIGDTITQNGLVNIAHIQSPKSSKKTKKQEESKDDAEKLRWLLGVASVVLMATAGFFVGKSLGQVEEENLILEKFKYLRGYYYESDSEFDRYGFKIENPLNQVHSQNLSLVHSTISQGMDLYSQKRTSALVNLYLRIGLVAAAAVGLLGALSNAPTLMVFSVFAIACLGTSSLIKYGYGLAMEKSQADRIAKLVNHLTTLSQKLKDQNVYFFVPVTPSAPPL